MEKLSEISLGRKGKVLKFGSLFICVLIIFVFFLGVYKVSIPEYANVTIVSKDDKILLVSNTKLNSIEKIKFENDKFLNVTLKKIEVNQYEIVRSKLPFPIAQKWQENILTDGKILIGKQNFFQSILPFL